MADPSVADRWIARPHETTSESSGIRKVFELARSIKDPINLSIGQPISMSPNRSRQRRGGHRAGFNGYTLTQGIPELRPAARRATFMGALRRRRPAS